MKRSEINAIIKRFEILLNKNRFKLPPFLFFTLIQWKAAGHEYDEIRDNRLGWDVTDYEMGNYEQMGLALITLRNGNLLNEKYSKSYSEKIIMIEEGQISPMHFHYKKMEDIINRGGGNLIFQLYNVDEDGQPAETDVEICHDGRRYMVQGGTEILLSPGESLTLYPYCYHGFKVQPGSGTVLAGEVSKCNDDIADNRFLQEIGRFPVIDEDEEPYRLLCSEYPLAL